jgi:hypothetical protein
LSVEKYLKTIKKEIILLIIYQSDLLPGTQTACKQRTLELSSHYCYVKNNMIHSKILWEGKKQVQAMHGSTNIK